MNTLKIKTFIFIACLALLFKPLIAQETQLENNSTNLEDELFGGDDDMLVSQEETSSNKESEFKVNSSFNSLNISLEAKRLKIGGALRSSLDLNYFWDDAYSKKKDYAAYFTSAKGSLLTSLNANLFFDARPIENLKLYGKFLFSLPFEKTITAQGTAFAPPIPPIAPKGLSLPVISQVTGVPNIKLHELYTDFSAKDIAFFRFGKHTVKWGTGYFYSPADVINISRIDPENPNAEREGAVSLRTHIIIPKTQHNLWLYILPPTKSDSFDPKYTGGALKAEFVFGNWEMGAGGYYKYKKAPRLITTFSGSIAGKVAVFAEGVFAWGSDYTYYKNDSQISGYTVKDKPFFQATLGGSYSNSNSNTSIAMQYYYNGFGYSNMDAVNTVLNKAAQTINYSDPVLSKASHIAAMENKGQHYIALTVAQNKIGTEKLSANVFQQFAISELEGFTKLSLNWNIYKFASVNTGIGFYYPLSSASAAKGSIIYSLMFRLGGGKF